jgi:hypothetical protein
MGRRVLLAQPGAAVNAPRAVVVSGNPADWTPHVLDGKVAAIVQVGDKNVADGQFTQVASAAAPTTAINRSNILALRRPGRGADRGPRRGLHVYAITTGASTVDFPNGLPTGSAPSSVAPPPTASPGSPGGCRCSTLPT